jgi:MFS family permease
MGGAKSQSLGLRTFSVMIGSLVEQYDFLVTGTVAALIWPQVFFPKETTLATAVFTSVAIYGLGLIIRPVGAYFWGHIGECRRNNWSAF